MLFEKISALPILLVSLLAGGYSHAANVPPDPLDSVMWKSVAERFFDGEIRFDQRVRVLAPVSAEDQFQVPITVEATALENVEEIIAVADLNPIPLILRYRPHQAEPYIGFRLKLQQASPVRVGVRTADGVWHVNGVVVDAAGGGCTAPAMAHGVDNWMSTLGQARAVARIEAGSVARLALRINHPMDTGLADGIPVFYLNTLQIKEDGGNVLADIELFEPVGENPVLNLKPRLSQTGEQTLQVAARDTEANEFFLQIPLVESSAEAQLSVKTDGVAQE